ncbi:MAG: hypothetical protein ACYCTH_10680 [Cellulomonas sp.]
MKPLVIAYVELRRSRTARSLPHPARGPVIETRAVLDLIALPSTNAHDNLHPRFG